MIVVDSNIVAYLYLPGEYTARAEGLLEQEPDWAAPILWRSEFRNILTGYYRKAVLPFEKTQAILREAEDLLNGSEFVVSSATVMDLVGKSECSAYDCEFVALALELQTKLVTMDKKILRAFPDYCVSLGQF